MISGKIIQRTSVNMIIRMKGMTPRMISAIVSPRAGSAVPLRTKIDIAIGGVWKAICRFMQIIRPAHRGLKPKAARIGEKIGTMMNTMPIHSMNIPNRNTMSMITAKEAHLPPGTERMIFVTTSPDPALMKIPTKA